MTDTQRTRAQVLALFADNVTGQVSAQDLRDFVVTVMEAEFANPGDFWAQPDARQTNTDGTARGWILNSQYVGEAVSFMNILYMDQSTGIWYKADAAVSTENGVLGVAMDSFAINASQASVLMKGVIYNSSFSTVFSRKIGQPVYLESGVAGSISLGKPAQSAWSELTILGVVMPSTGLSVTSAWSTSGKWFFNPQWSVKDV